jgi:hypothetical protein
MASAVKDKLERLPKKHPKNKDQIRGKTEKTQAKILKASRSPSETSLSSVVTKLKILSLLKKNQSKVNCIRFSVSTLLVP